MFKGTRRSTTTRCRAACAKVRNKREDILSKQTNRLFFLFLRTVYMDAWLVHLARLPGKRDEFILCYGKIASHLPGQLAGHPEFRIKRALFLPSFSFSDYEWLKIQLI
jgi:hypothetical protein